MESTEESKYEVIITAPAEISFYQVLEYLYDNYSLNRAEQIADELREATKKLHYQPARGTLEPQLSNRLKEYRYVLYKRTSRTEIKIIYYLEKSTDIVYITDFFPVEMDDHQIQKRSK